MTAAGIGRICARCHEPRHGRRAELCRACFVEVMRIRSLARSVACAGCGKPRPPRRDGKGIRCRACAIAHQRRQLEIPVVEARA